MMTTPAPSPDADGRHPVVLFDGVCNLCNWSVDFIIRRDPALRFRFASLQSPIGQSLSARHGLVVHSPGSMVLIEGGRCYTRSAAALRIARRLSAPWPMLYVFMMVPAFARDAAYDCVARNRYRWFGRTDACRVPTPELMERFLDRDASST